MYKKLDILEEIFDGCEFNCKFKEAWNKFMSEEIVVEGLKLKEGVCNICKKIFIASKKNLIPILTSVTYKRNPKIGEDEIYYEKYVCICRSCYSKKVENPEEAVN